MNPRWIETGLCVCDPARVDVFPLNAGRCVRGSTQPASRDKNKPANYGSSRARILYPSSGTVAKFVARLADYNYVAEANCAQARAREMTQTRSTETNWTKMERVN